MWRRAAEAGCVLVCMLVCADIYLDASYFLPLEHCLLYTLLFCCLSLFPLSPCLLGGGFNARLLLSIQARGHNTLTQAKSIAADTSRQLLRSLPLDNTASDQRV
jgi:hypothetical protein